MANDERSLRETSIYRPPRERISPDELRLSAGQHMPPIDPVKIANAAGVSVYLNDFGPEDGENVAGSIVIQNGRPKIYVSRKDSFVRQRFTVAHELGHLAMGHLTNADGKLIEDEARQRSSAWDIQERDANAFAADLLMPYALLRDAIGAGIQDIDKLSLLFGVSSQAMRIRIINVLAKRMAW